MNVFSDIKVNIYIYSPDIPVGSEDFTSITLSTLELALSQSHLTGENAAQFSTAEAIHSTNFVPPGTHYAGWTEAMWIQSLPKSFTNV